MPRRLWCHVCEATTDRDQAEFERTSDADGENGDLVCVRCGNEYRCTECGWDVDADARCTRTADGGGTCPTTTEGATP